MESETAIRIKVLVDFEERDNFSLAREVEVGLTDEALLAIAEGIIAAQQTRAADCEHVWVSADNEVVSGGEICLKCLTVRSC